MHYSDVENKKKQQQKKNGHMSPNRLASTMSSWIVKFNPIPVLLIDVDIRVLGELYSTRSSMLFRGKTWLT